MFYHNNFKMFTLISLMIIYTIGLCQIDCIPVQNIESVENTFDLSDKLANNNRDETKIEKRSHHSLYQSEITPTLSGQKIANNILEEAHNERSAINIKDIINRIKGDEPRYCQIGTSTRDMCETCAKATKSEMAFALCCVNKENVRDWCEKFINFEFINVATSFMND